MTYLAKAILLSATLGLGLAGCSSMSPDRFDNVTDLNASGGANGLPSDPTSPAYFQQAVGDRVLFEVDQSTLNPAARQILDQQVQWLLANADYQAQIEGHADEQGTREYNLALGASRATSVRDYLVSMGVPDYRLSTISYGKERPLEICSAEACYAKNRRAVTVLKSGAGF
ncbi:peptidoglycan-associated lipoprotein [Pseudooceanicola antarcticus]|uniref:Peptidoglycan-associated lipoprotein n=1 Tax=Pseudooceanicola antarcticus TaxID=1247613 RepID=A0A285ITC1_9RHOB|nr:peptidoglycan-associated lipoprotein Pal [Pseudooceanicola antarcticus]PJE31944.1 peptidoglycan-associated lipoprotein [Pseudooceanicola antarcticus]SNY50937.1 peptidoglycan-associated lipoprotein [Pseudooceanicola antarcticus]